MKRITNLFKDVAGLNKIKTKSNNEDAEDEQVYSDSGGSDQDIDSINSGYEIPIRQSINQTTSISDNNGSTLANHTYDEVNENIYETIGNRSSRTNKHGKNKNIKQVKSNSKAAYSGYNQSNLDTDSIHSGYEVPNNRSFKQTPSATKLNCANDDFNKTFDNCSSKNNDYFDLDLVPTVKHFENHAWNKDRIIKNNLSNKQINKDHNKIYSKNGKQYIKKIDKNNKISYSGKFKIGNLYVKIHNEANLLTYDGNNFVAIIKFEDLKNLNFNNFFEVKRELLKRIIIVEVLRDNLNKARNDIFNNFKQFVTDMSEKTSKDINCAQDLLQFYNIVYSCKSHDNFNYLLTNIIDNKYVSENFIRLAEKLKEGNETLYQRNRDLPCIQNSIENGNNLIGEFRNICDKGIKHHKRSLLENIDFELKMCHVIDARVESLSRQQALYLNSKDIDTFTDLSRTLNSDVFNQYLDGLLDKFFEKVSKIKSFKSIKEVAPLTFPIFYHICKSFQETLFDLSKVSGIGSSKLFVNEKGVWKPPSSIKWDNENSETKILENQYRFLYELMNFFEPGKYSSKNKFKYTCLCLKDFNDSLDEDRLVWIYILDKSICELFTEESNKEVFEPLLKGFINFIESTRENSYELFRVVTHNIAKFIIKTISFANAKSDIDKSIFNKQIEFINRSIRETFDSDVLRDLISVYNVYWSNREIIIQKISQKFEFSHFKNSMQEIGQQLLNIIDNVLVKSIQAYDLVNFFRSYNEFLEDIDCVEMTWFVKCGFNTGCVKPIDNNKGSYEVSDVPNFLTKCGSDIPRHYIIEVMSILLKCVVNSLELDRWNDKDTVKASSELMSAMRKSLLYLKEQPDYYSFDTFLKESTEPFLFAVENSASPFDFIKRISIVGESFWFLRKQDEIDIEKALELYKNLNSGTEISNVVLILKQCYDRYIKKFESFIESNINGDSNQRISAIIREVKEMLKSINVTNWDKKFKQETVPEVLAGLGAVWSIRESVDLACNGKSLKPHCIQILCILNLLSVEKEAKGVDKHLAQVLTGQGKSLVLGLLSTLLALTGHKIRTVCYSQYLASRDLQDFRDFFNLLGVTNEITYYTFDDMANELLRPEVDGNRVGIRELVEKQILSPDVIQKRIVKREDTSSTILLIDEVDVFFSNEFYGSLYNPVTTIKLKALAIIQEKIWEMVSNSKLDQNEIQTKIEEFIASKLKDRDEDFKEFNKHKLMPGKYFLLKTEGDGLVKKQYTNSTLFQEEFERLIKNALEVRNGNETDWFINRYKLNDNNVITYRRSDGLYVSHTFCSYYNIFNYFRLKRREFDTKFYENYGYLNIDCGQVSYSSLPKKYPLILGVSGTLTNLYSHERDAISKSYGINKITSMPSFFGNRNLKFTSYNDFSCQKSEDDWLSTIYNHTNTKINSGVSVLIFFNTDVELNKFKDKYLSKFERLSVLTENIRDIDKKKIINEAGISKTVTLCTRGMGRGVDFKSSVAVERTGGMHVVQTFFCIDVKEETQIKGRTARKDNKGTFEIITYKKQLVDDGFISDELADVNYQMLNQSRDKLMANKGNGVEEKISKAEKDHQFTMDYFDSFFKT